MSLPQFVSRRGETLYYRRAFPKELWPVTGRGAFAMSLRTGDPRQALRARPEAERRYCERVDAARAALAQQSHRPPLTKAAAEALAVHWFREALETAEDFRAALVRGPQEAQQAREDAEWAAGEARRALAEGDLTQLKATAQRLRDEAGFASEPLADSALVTLLGRARVAVEEVAAGRAVARFDARPADPLFASAMNRPPPAAPQAFPSAASATPQVGPSGRTVAELIADYRKAKFGQFTESTKRAYVPVIRALEELVGTDTKLATLTREDGDRLFAAIQAIPTNAQKHNQLKGLPLQQQIAKGKRLGLPTLSAKTVNDGYMAHISALFSFAHKRGWVNANPVAGLRAREKTAAADKREPFNGRLPALFGARPWSPRDASSPVKYFGPLLALYHGLRLAEIVGLEVADIGSEEGHPMIYIRAGKRSLKGRGSRRDLPMHPELIRLGFSEFASKRAEAAPADAMLFEGEHPNGRGQWGRKLGTWFVALVNERGLKGRNLGIHALRHDFRDALREAGIEEPLADYLFGHARKGVAGVYGGDRPYSRIRLAEAIAKVRYAGVKLPKGRR